MSSGSSWFFYGMCVCGGEDRELRKVAEGGRETTVEEVKDDTSRMKRICVKRS